MEGNNNNNKRDTDENTKRRSRRIVPATSSSSSSPGAVASTLRLPDQDTISKPPHGHMVSAATPRPVAAQHLKAEDSMTRAGVARSGESQRTQPSPRPVATRHGQKASQHAAWVSETRDTLRAMQDNLLAKTNAVGTMAAASQSSRAWHGGDDDDHHHQVGKPGGGTAAAPGSETLFNIRDLEANKEPLPRDIIPETPGDGFVEGPPPQNVGEVGAGFAYEVADTEAPEVVEPATGGGGDEVYPGAVQPSGAEGIEAFVASQAAVVDATGVRVVMSDEEEEKMEQRKCQRWLLYGGIAFVLIVAVVVVVLLVIPQSGGGDPEPLVPIATASSMSPSGAPSASPTSDRLNAVIGHVAPISGSEVFLDFESPQYRAAVWLADVDPLNLAVSQLTPQLLQRYALAVLYYAMNGDMWLSCFTTDVSCPSGQNWLTQGECLWFGLTCAGAEVTRLTGKSNIACVDSWMLA